MLQQRTVNRAGELRQHRCVCSVQGLIESNQDESESLQQPSARAPGFDT